MGCSLNMKKAILLGDSIRLLGYGLAVPQVLEREVEIWQPEENCRFAQHTLRGLVDWAEDMKDADVIHWNNGHWDYAEYFGDGEFTPLDVYVETMCRIGRILLSRCDKVIFATNTPVRDGAACFKNSNVIRYNNAVVPRLREMGIIINDLHSVVAADVERYICEDQVHLSEDGIEVCAKQVADTIREVIKG